MLPALIVFAYLALVLYIGIFAFRRSRGGAEDFFLANRSLGPAVFLLSLFGSNMTAFSILGSSGLAFRIGIGVFGLLASLVVMSYVFFGGMRGTAWVNTLQTLMFLIFGTITFFIISHAIGGFEQTTQRMLDGPD